VTPRQLTARAPDETLDHLRKEWIRKMIATVRGPSRFGARLYGLLLLSGACAPSGDCANEMISERPSLDGGQRAVVFHRSCGANAGFSTHVSLVPGNDALPDSVGNLFIANTNQGTAPAGPHGGPAIEVRWIARDTIEVRFHPRARVFARQARVNGVEVRYTHDLLAARVPSSGRSR
jgi:hypothetical protein